MSELSDKASGIANQAAGKIKQGVGNATGSERLEAEGAAQEAKGAAQKAYGAARGAVRDPATTYADRSPPRLGAPAGRPLPRPFFHCEERPDAGRLTRLTVRSGAHKTKPVDDAGRGSSAG